MKRLLLSALTVLLGLSAAAQTVLQTRPAAPAERAFTQEDLYFSSRLTRTSAFPQWLSDDTYAWYDGEWQLRSIDPEREPAGPKRIRTPEGTACEAVSGERVAYSLGQSLYWKEGSTGIAVPIATGGDGIVYGETVSRNEFGINGGIFWSPDGKKIAFYRKDESRVTLFPLLDITTRTGTLREIRYPMNGMDSERITLGVYDCATGGTVWMDVRDFTEERYLTNITWTPDSQEIWIQVLDRSQHEMHLNAYDAATGEFLQTLLTESNDAWIEPLDPIRFFGGRSDLFLYRTDNRDGYRNLYLCDREGGVRRLTGVPADVAYVAHNENAIWYTSAEVSPIENHLFRIDLKLGKPGRSALKRTKVGKPQRLTAEPGWHDIAMNGDATWYIDSWSSLDQPDISVLRSCDGKAQEELWRSPNPIEGFDECAIEMGTVPSADGAFENYYRLTYPSGFDPSKRYPLIVYVYGGPHSELVRNTWLGDMRLWEMLMAQQGYFVYVQDNRGTENRGAAFEKAINRRCGAVEMEDQMEGIRMLTARPYIDAERIGVHGWSYGGFMTISLITHYPEVFKVGVAGGPVIDWKWYEVMYGERYMDNPETNPEGFAETSLIAQAPNLRGKLLICQGAIDNTCVWQHSLSFVEACIENYIPVDYMPYPRAEHNVRAPLRAHLMAKVTQYFNDYL